MIPKIVAGLDDRYAIRGKTGGSEERDIDAMLARALGRLGESGSAHAPAGPAVDTLAR